LGEEFKGTGREVAKTDGRKGGGIESEKKLSLRGEEDKLHRNSRKKKGGDGKPLSITSHGWLIGAKKGPPVAAEILGKRGKKRRCGGKGEVPSLFNCLRATEGRPLQEERKRQNKEKRGKNHTMDFEPFTRNRVSQTLICERREVKKEGNRKSFGFGREKGGLRENFVGRSETTEKKVASLFNTRAYKKKEEFTVPLKKRNRKRERKSF